ncbi:hypothetical protein AX774_g1530 [Zancudomyces culisetae]|uniref:Uncharacterized protein n=1 Tax=Zancudomyces culisetae TaxID=1213189 RepID=A0A1R1PVF0_ZANCU|nr:hypothetical protein AX774_g1530 [Zancudomyces culisetae]|eukprot:OMH84940.1 hypothetical protein AX774_g1530 [Zancudomyces culisetae]
MPDYPLSLAQSIGTLVHATGAPVSFLPHSRISAPNIRVAMYPNTICSGKSISTTIPICSFFRPRSTSFSCIIESCATNPNLAIINILISCCMFRNFTISYIVRYVSIIPGTFPYCLSSSASFTNSTRYIVTSAYITPHTRMYPPNVHTPHSSSSLRRYLLLSSAVFSARNTVKLRKYPLFSPIVWQLLAYPTRLRLSIVSAHPSTAMSCVALSITIVKNIVANCPTPIRNPWPPGISISITRPTLYIITASTSCTGTIQLFRRPPKYRLHHCSLVPRPLRNKASTIGDQNSLSEYGYVLSEKFESCE